MAGPFVAPVLLPKSSTYVQEYPRTLGALKTRIARTLGGTNSAQVLELAEEGILRGVDDMNMRHYFRFALESPVSSALVSGQTAYDVPAGTFNLADVQLYDTDGKPYRTLRYLDWGAFNRAIQQQTTTGTPEIFSARNMFADGEIQVYPIPDATAQADYSLRMTAYERIPKPTSDSSVIAAPVEIQDVLITYAEYYALSVRHREMPALWGHKLREYRDKLGAFMRMTEREPSEDLRWRMAWDNDPALDSRLDPLS